MVAALPLGGVGIPVHQAALAVVGVLVPRHEASAAAALLKVTFLQKTGLQLLASKVRHNLDVGGQGVVTAAGGLHILHHQDGGIGPAFHELPVDQVVFDDNVLPAQGQRTVGARLQVQPVVGFFAGAGQTRVDADVDVGLGHLEHDVTARVVVVRILGRSAPLHVHARSIAQGKPRGAVNGGHPAHQTTGTLADRRSHAAVGAVEQPLEEGVRAVHPLAGRAAHAEAGLATVLIDGLVELLADGLHGLVPGNANPTRVLALGVGALHGMVDTCRVIARLQGRLALAAVIAE